MLIVGVNQTYQKTEQANNCFIWHSCKEGWLALKTEGSALLDQLLSAAPRKLPRAPRRTPVSRGTQLGCARTNWNKNWGSVRPIIFVLFFTQPHLWGENLCMFLPLCILNTIDSLKCSGMTNVAGSH